MYRIAVNTRVAVLLTAVFMLAGCQPQAVRPDSKQPAVTDIDAIELQQQAQKAYAAGDWAEAERTYAALTQQVPKEAEPWFRLGNIYARQDRPQQAIAAYKEALVRQPKHAKAWHNMGIIQLRQASNSFSHLQNVTETGDPLNDRAGALLDTMTRLLETDFKTPDAPAEDAATDQ